MRERKQLRIARDYSDQSIASLRRVEGLRQAILDKGESMDTCVKTFKHWWASRPISSTKIDAEALTQSQCARIGMRIINSIRFTEVIEPICILALLLISTAIDAFAQTPSGNIFGSDQQVGNAIREAIKWGRNLLFLLGIVFVGWGIVNFGSDKPAAKQIVAAIGCFAFGGIVALVYSISQGNAVNLDTGFGN